MRIDNTVNWYESDAILSIMILKSHINSIENQIKISVEEFERNKETIILEEYPNEYYTRIITLHNGLDDETFDMEKVFNEYLPNLQRYSVLITLFSFLEHELDKLSIRIKIKDNLPLELNDINGKGINRSLKYLNKVAGIKVNRNSELWNEILNIQKLRNLIVHNGGRLIDQSGKSKLQEIKYVTQSSLLDGGIDLTIKDGFLISVIETFDRLLKEIDTCIKVKYKS